jgi:hypothetical protein
MVQILFNIINTSSNALMYVIVIAQGKEGLPGRVRTEVGRIVRSGQLKTGVSNMQHALLSKFEQMK